MSDLSTTTTLAQASNEKNELNHLQKKGAETVPQTANPEQEQLSDDNSNKGVENNPQPNDGSVVVNNPNLIKEPQLKDLVNQWLTSPFDNSQLPQLVEDANSTDRIRQHHGVTGIRKILSNAQGPPIQEVIDAKIVPKLLEFMKNDSEPQLQLEAAWALTNIASGTTEQTKFVIDKGGIPSFIKLLKSPEPAIAEQAIWALGNISGDTAAFRDMILKRGGLPALIQLVSNSSDRSVIKNGTWAISNLCRGKPLPELRLVEAAIPILSTILQRETDIDILTDASWALSYLSRSETNIKQVTDSGVISTAVKYMNIDYAPLLIPCVRILGNIATGDEEQTNLLLQVPEFIPKLILLLDAEKTSIRREVCWTISNITAGSPNQIEAIISNEHCVETLIDIVLSDVPEVAREAAWALSNATKNCNPPQITRLIEMDILYCFSVLLDNQDPTLVELALEAIKNILDCGSVIATQNGSENQFLVAIKEEGLTEIIEGLASEEDEEIASKAKNIVEKYFKGQ